MSQVIFVPPGLHTPAYIMLPFLQLGGHTLLQKSNYLNYSE